jgi:GDPmannose 4,6-dehydratase
LIGDASKAKRQLGWEPKVKFEKLAELMIEADLELAERELRGKAH